MTLKIDAHSTMHIMWMLLLVLFIMVIQKLIASQGKPTRPPLFNMLIRTHRMEWWSLCSRDVETWTVTSKGIKPGSSEPKPDTFTTEPVSLTYLFTVTKSSDLQNYLIKRQNYLIKSGRSSTFQQPLMRETNFINKINIKSELVRLPHVFYTRVNTKLFKCVNKSTNGAPDE